MGDLPGGFDVMSTTTREIPSTSLTILREIYLRSWNGNSNGSQDMKLNLYCWKLSGFKLKICVYIYLVIEGRDEDVVGLSNNLNPFRGNLAKDPNSNTRSWESVPYYKILINTKLTAECPDFVLEKLSEGPKQLELRLLRFISVIRFLR